ncbi:LacI family DNA-binding transcriptional regulator [Marinomonas transparens]|uniref:LacI family DNA-binding transcriptional regulator n=1 Tax=Marinomonas transparens TaxID=2795388 RepID=A0A934JM68_9GAMM|nr:LacI family DNA-binding transcriptional regulator [Marinomonas transparens]MBJ7538755.1 LacI family DNA-binding transcriptional regulator [Marinomonas transparens]
MTNQATVKKITIKEVAKDAGVSVAAVSKVIRNAYGVSPALRKKVELSIKVLGYRPNTSARGMRGKTFTIGVLIAGLGNAYLPKLLEKINATIEKSDFKMLIGLGQGELSIESSLIESMIDNNVDGLILVAPRLSGTALEKYAKQIPMTVIGHVEDTAVSFDTINGDDYLGAQLATKALINTGVENVKMISLLLREFDEFDLNRERERGFLATLKEANISNGAEDRIFRSSDNEEQLRKDLNLFLDDIKTPCAIFCWSDIHAVPLLDECQKRHLVPQKDVFIIGYDNTPIASYAVVNLSSIDQQAEVQGELAADAILERIKGRSEAKHCQVAPTLIARKTH